MEISENNIDKLDYHIILDEIKRGKKGYNLLKTTNFNFDSKAIMPYLMITGIFFLCFFKITWSDGIWLFIAIIVFSFFASGIFVSYETSYLYFNKDVIFIFQDHKFIYFPASEFLTYQFYTKDSQKHISLYFKNAKCCDFKYEGEIKLFIDTLIQTSRASQDDLISKNKYNLLELLNSSNKSSNLNKHVIKKSLRIIGTITIILFLIAPFELDWNGYRNAIKTNTASSLRGYLSENKNFLFREEVKNLLIGKYNSYINQYKTKYSNSNPVQSLVKLLEYLRDNDLDEVNVVFKNYSEIRDVKTRLYVVSIQNTLNQQFIKEREKELIKTLNQTVGKVFPTDIFTLGDLIQNKRVPEIAITYTYTNSNVKYFSTDEEKVDEIKRTYYYGILITWDFKMFLPFNTNPIYSFSLESTPSPTFHSQGREEGNVYSYMIYSAFDNFAKAYENHFFY
jgi:hypothetical protein